MGGLESRCQPSFCTPQLHHARSRWISKIAKKSDVRTPFPFGKAATTKILCSSSRLFAPVRSDCSRVSVFVGNGRSLYRCDVTCMFFVSGYAFPNVPLAPFFSSRSEKAGFTNRSIKISTHKVLLKHPKTRGWSAKSFGFTGLDV